jgi:hypothetical protein
VEFNPPETPNPQAYNGVPFAMLHGSVVHFRGQFGVDFSLFYFGPAAHALVGNFRTNYVGPGKQGSQFVAANPQASRFEQSYYLFRIKGGGPSDVLIVPYEAGKRPRDLSCTLHLDGKVSLVMDDRTRILEG